MVHSKQHARQKHRSRQLKQSSDPKPHPSALPEDSGHRGHHAPVLRQLQANSTCSLTPLTRITSTQYNEIINNINNKNDKKNNIITSHLLHFLELCLVSHNLHCAPQRIPNLCTTQPQQQQQQQRNNITTS
jgi:hypothetical protein